MSLSGRVSLLSAGLFLSFALLAGRLAGFAREIILASSLGLSIQADIAIILLTIPDLLVNLLLSGGMGIALIPALRSLNANKAAALFFQASLVVGAVFAAVSVLFVLLPSVCFWLLAPGLPDPLRYLDSWMIYIVAAAIPLTALSGVSTAALNSRDKFFVSGCGTLIFNLSIIASLLIAMSRGEQYLAWLCFGILCGVVVRWWSQLLAMRDGVHGRLVVRHEWLVDNYLLRRFLVGLASSSLLVLVPVILRAGATNLGEGELAAFNYAIKLVELPIGILITTLATVAFPQLSAAHTKIDTSAFGRLLSDVMQRSLVLSAAVVLCGLPFIDSAVYLLFSSGRLDIEGLYHITRLAQVALLSVPFVAVSSLAAAALNAGGGARIVLRGTCIVMLILLLFCIPGLLLKEPVMLMGALPAFYMIYSFCLVRAVERQAFLRQGLIIVSSGVCYFIVIGCVVVVSTLIDALFLKAVLSSQSLWVVSLCRIGLAGVTFVVSLIVGLYMKRIFRIGIV
ncbi:murein biosynthesis integral membrane protein MurJ [Pseudomonas tohonis]|uniref:murein biosynthesis integral membrane protein MurJ n=1 Tax=Pseudomonas tohonis TaxID=2725477 RepID=UPI001F1FD115|nr:lipid II flippase MurJ [Pseudomonas tohonis]